MNKRFFLLSALLISAGFLIGANYALAADNTAVRLERLFPGQYDNTKYKIVTSDPDGVKYILVNKANGQSIYGGEPPCLTSLDSGTVTLLTTDFPLSATVKDCAGGVTIHKITASLESTSVVAQSITLTPGNDHYFQVTSGTLTFGDVSSGGITPSTSWALHTDIVFVFKTGDNKPAWNDSASAIYYFKNDNKWYEQGSGTIEVPATSKVPNYFVIRHAANASASTLTLPSNVIFSGSVPINQQPRPWDNAAGTYGKLSGGVRPVAHTEVLAGSRQTLGRFMLDASGSIEDIRVGQLMPNLTFTIGKSADLTNCQLYGESYAEFMGSTALNTGPKTVNPAYASTANYNFVFDTPLVVAKGTIKELYLACSISSSAVAGSSYSWGFGQYGVLEVTGVSSGAHITPIVAVSSGSAVSVVSPASSLTIDKNANFSDQTFVAGNTNAILGSFEIKAGAGENVNVTAITINLDPAEFSSTILTRMYLKDRATGVDGTPLGGIIKSSLSASNAFAVSINLAAGASKIIDLYGDIRSSADAGTWRANVSVSGAGATSGNAISAVGIDLQTINITSAGSLVVNGGSMPTSAILIAGSSNNRVAQYKFIAAKEGFTINKLKLQANNDLVNSVANVIIKYKNKAGAVQEAKSLFISKSASVFSFATFIGLNIYVPAEGEANIDVYLDLVSLAESGRSGAEGSITLLDSEGFDATGDSGSSVTSCNNNDGSYGIGSESFYIRKSKPTLTKLGAGADPVNGPLYKFSVAADVAGNIEIKQLSFKVITDGVTVGGLYLYDPNTFTQLTDIPVNPQNGIAVLPVGKAQDNDVLAIGTTPKTYEVRGTVTGWGDGGSISIGFKEGDGYTPEADGSVRIHSSTGTVNAIMAEGGYNIWSDRSASAHAVNTADWTNGYLIKDLTGIQSFVKESTTTSSITVLSPNGGETIKIGEKYNIKWDLSNAFSTVSIKLKNESINCSAGMLGCQNVYGIGHNLPNTGSYTWDTIKKMSGSSTGPDSVALRPGSKYKIRICHSTPEVCDDSNNYFTVSNALSNASIILLSPNGGEIWRAGGIYSVKWNSTGLPNDAQISFNLLNRAANNDIIGSLITVIHQNTGSYNYTVPLNIEPGSNYVMIISVCALVDGVNTCDDTRNPYAGIKDISDSHFTITSPIPQSSLTVSLESSTEDRAGLWDNFGPGAGNYNKDTTDWAWSMTLRSVKDVQIKSMTILSNNSGEGWSTSADTSLLGKKLYPLVVLSEKQNQLNSSYDQSLGSYAVGTTNTFSLYGQKESTQFIGGRLIVEFSDGTKVEAKITTGSSYGYRPFKPEPIAIVKEQVKCVFKGSTTEQKCYSSGDSGAYFGLSYNGTETAGGEIEGKYGDKIIWKSTCGGYAYTVMDGVNEYAIFNCSQAVSGGGQGSGGWTSAQQIADINEKSKLLFYSNFGFILAELNQLRDLIKEQQTEIKYLKSLVKDLKNISESALDAINNFITYGVDANTEKLGAGERAAVINSYKAAFLKLPETEAELADAIKIANGRWPSLTNSLAERKAKEQFQKIYKRIADMNNVYDNAAVTVMAYGLRQKAQNRNLNSEKAGIKTFRAIYGHAPNTTEEWNIMQAITYSGAGRGADSDGDLLTDAREAELGTDPKNKDTDGDGYLDGVEVANGFDPLKK